ncbi:hypothetical protein D3C85_1671770 [compost metagenome]
MPPKNALLSRAIELAKCFTNSLSFFFAYPDQRELVRLTAFLFGHTGKIQHLPINDEFPVFIIEANRCHVIRILNRF